LLFSHNYISKSSSDFSLSDSFSFAVDKKVYEYVKII